MAATESKGKVSNLTDTTLFFMLTLFCVPRVRALIKDNPGIDGTSCVTQPTVLSADSCLVVQKQKETS